MAIQDILPNKVKHVITRMCLFINVICSKFIEPIKLDDFENEVAIILCQLKMYFPLLFFNIMVHLIFYLVREIKLCGPVYLWWMHPIEKFMKILNGYTKSLHCPKAPIIER